METRIYIVKVAVRLWSSDPPRHCLPYRAEGPQSVRDFDQIRRLSRDQAGTDRRRHDRRFDHHGSRARSDRNRHRELARFRRRPRRSRARCPRAPPPRCPGRRAASTSRSPSSRPGARCRSSRAAFRTQVGRSARCHRSERRREEFAGAHPGRRLAAAKGSVRPDGAALEQWDPEVAARRRRARHDPAAAVRWLQHSGTMLSAGNGSASPLARPLHRDRFLGVLDEPSSNLDNEGETDCARPSSTSRRGAPSSC